MWFVIDFYFEGLRPVSSISVWRRDVSIAFDFWFEVCIQASDRQWIAAHVKYTYVLAIPFTSKLSWFIIIPSTYNPVHIIHSLKPLSWVTNCQQLSVVGRTQSSSWVPSTNSGETGTGNNTTASSDLTSSNVSQCRFGRAVQPWVEESKTRFSGCNTVGVDELDNGTKSWGCARSTVDEFSGAGGDNDD